MGEPLKRADQQQRSASIWTNDDEVKLLRRRALNFWNRDYLERIIMPILSLPKGAQVLDVGSGYGGLSLPLARAKTDAWVLGLDCEPQAVEGAATLAKELGVSNVGFRQGDAAALPFEDSSFDAVCCQTLLTHVAEPEVVLRDMKRVLKPSGVMFTVEYDYAGVFSSHDNWKTEATVAEAVRHFRLARLYIEGKKHLGRGDDTLGVRLPFLMHDLGLTILDVRKNDRAWHAFPPYHKESEQRARDAMLDFSEALSDETKQWMSENIRAGGGSDEDVAAYLAMVDDAVVKARTRDAVEQGCYRVLSSYTFYLTIARKPQA